ncbi:uncharacterized protein DDB_G0284459 isoform X2 [Plutella xylostella]|uniref:uncharacterized protein DDB_G0284459 isoform X2 n=1 Tax=Plutella xylostella TaxID=51655 RepID=UPI0020322FB7|nr:uncharacterized protein DDB_G0284459 isoform X2 [Plutella xylostella]
MEKKTKNRKIKKSSRLFPLWQWRDKIGFVLCVVDFVIKILFYCTINEMATNFFIHKSGRWLQLDLEDASIDGIREKPRFLYVSKGTLQVIPTSLILRGLKALHSGEKSAVRAGLILPKHRKHKKHRRHKHRRSLSHCCRCEHGNGPSCIQPTILTTNVKSISDAVTQTNTHNPTQTPVVDKKNDIHKEYKSLQIQPKAVKNSVDKRAMGSDSDTPCKELYIDIQDIEYIKSVLAQNPQFLGPFDEETFNKDSAYRNVILFQLNPLVKIERVINLERLLGNNDLSLVEFAALLGLTHVTAKKSKDYAYKTRQKVNEAHDNYRQMKQLKKQTLSISSDDDKENEQSREKTLKPQVATSRAERVKKYMTSFNRARGKKGRFLKKSSNVKGHSGNDRLQKKLDNKAVVRAIHDDSSDTDVSYDNDHKKLIKKITNVNSSDSYNFIMSKHDRGAAKEDAAIEGRVTRRSILSGDVKNVVNNKETIKKQNESNNKKNQMNSSSSDEDQLSLKHLSSKRNKKAKYDETENSSSDGNDTSNSDQSTVTTKRQSARLSEVAKSKIIVLSTDSEEESENAKCTSNRKPTNNNGNENKAAKRPFIQTDASDSETEFVTTKYASQSKKKDKVNEKLSLSNADKQIQGRNKDTDKRAGNDRKRPKLNEDNSEKESKKDSDSSETVENSVIKSKRLSRTDTRGEKNNADTMARPISQNSKRNEDIDKNATNNTKKTKLNDDKSEKGSKEDSDSSKSHPEAVTKQKNTNINIKSDTRIKPNSLKSSSEGSSNSLNIFKKKMASLASKKLGIKNKTKFKPMKPGIQKGASSYTSLEDHAIISWVSLGQRARGVNGNQVWKELEKEYERITGTHRSWHSLRNRYLRYVLPSLGALCVEPAVASRLRAAAAKGNIKLARKASLNNGNAENSILRMTPVISASSRRPRPDRSLDLEPGTPGKPDERSRARDPGTGGKAGDEIPKSREKAASPRKSSTPKIRLRSPKSPKKVKALRSSPINNSPTYSDLTKRFMDKRSSGQLSRDPTPPEPEEKPSKSRRLFNPKAI